MKKIALLCSLMLGMSLNAQYYWMWGGTSDMDILHRGEVSAVGPAMTTRGHIMSGSRSVTGSAPVLGMAFDWDAGVVHFANQYRIKPSSMVLSQHTATKNLMLEINNGTTVYGMCGSLIQPGGTKYALYYFPVRANGATNAGATNGWIYDPGNFWQLDARDAITDGTNVYMVARAVNGTANYMALLSVNANTGVVNWSRYYWPVASTTWTTQPQKLILNTRTGNLVVVGYVNSGAAGAIDDGFIFTCAAATGNGGAWSFYGAPSSQERLTGVHMGDPGNAMGGGMYVTGNTNAGATNQNTWVMHVNDAPGAPNWNSTYDFGGFAGDNFGTDLTERYSAAAGAWQLYVSGYRGGANFDMTIQKLTGAGAIIAERGYGAAATESSSYIDFDEATVDDGLSIYGNSTDAQGNGNWDMSMFRTYFNLETPCNDYAGTPPAPGTGPGLASTYAGPYEIGLTRFSAYMEVISTFSKIRCAGAGYDPSGSNAKMAPAGLDLSGHASLGSLEVNLNSQEALPVKLTLTSLSGQVILTQTVDASMGDNKFTLESGSLPTGIYLLTATSSKEQVTKKILVQ